MSSSPQFAATPRVGIAQVSVANPNRDGTGTLATVLTAGASGTRIDYVAIKATGSTSAGMIRLYVHDGSNARLLSEDEVPELTVSAASKAHESLVELAGGIVIPTGYSLRASTEVGETFNIFAIGGDL